MLVSSGAIAAGLAPLGLHAPPAGPGHAAGRGERRPGPADRPLHRRVRPARRTVGQVLLTVDDVTRRAHYRNAYRTLRQLLDLRALPIVNENDTVATDEIRFGDNDRLAALVAHLVHADLLVLLSDVDGLYDRRPGATRRSRRIAEVRAPARPRRRRHRQAPARPGSAPAAWSPRSRRPGSPRPPASRWCSPPPPTPPRPWRAEPVGTLFHRLRRAPAGAAVLAGPRHRPAGPAAPRRRARCSAVVERRASLLPAGITAVDGRFAAGDPVDLVDAAGAPVARGLVNYDAAELPPLLGRSTGELAAALGPAYEREVVHRDDLVLL